MLEQALWYLFMLGIGICLGMLIFALWDAWQERERDEGEV
jgi:hypothetical protein